MIVSLRELKNNFDDYFKIMEENKEPIIVTKNSKKVAIIEPIKNIGAAKGNLEELPFDLDDQGLNEEIKKEFHY